MEENFEREMVPETVEDTQREDAILEEQARVLAEKEKKEKAKKDIRVSANRAGWATSLLMAVWMGCLFVVSLAAVILDNLRGAGYISFSGMELYEKYLLIINEATLAIGISAGFLLLLTIPKPKTEKNPIAFSAFLKILLCCFGAGYVGNLIGNMMLTFWNAVTGNTVGDELETLLTGINPLQIFLSVVILAPILEELFFRKLLIDRLRPSGQIVCIFLPAFLFALFHQSASQLIYAFTVGAILSYLYYKTGKYWLTVAIHALFNFISGFIPVLFLPKVYGFIDEFYYVMEHLSDTADFSEWMAQIMPLLDTYGFALALYGVYALILFAVNITGVVLLLLNIKNLRKLREGSVLSVSDTFKAAMGNPGMIVCTAALGLLTVFSLFA